MLPPHRTIGNQATLRLLSRPVQNAAAPSHAADAAAGGAPVQLKPNGALASVGGLAVTEPGDRHETEADSVARTIDHAAPPMQPSPSGPPMPLSPAGPPPPRVAPPGLTGRGSPLPRAVRDDFEQRFARPLDHVRIHTGGEAAVAARSLAARAFTVGSDIVFGRGEFAPDTGDGRRLLAHELTHVIQQASAGPRIARVPLDLDRVDTELRAGTPLTQTAGDIGFGSARGKPMDPPAEDTTLPIGAFVFPHTSASPTAKPPPGAGSAHPDAPGRRRCGIRCVTVIALCARAKCHDHVQGRRALPAGATGLPGMRRSEPPRSGAAKPCRDPAEPWRDPAKPWRDAARCHRRNASRDLGAAPRVGDRQHPWRRARPAGAVAEIAHRTEPGHVPPRLRHHLRAVDESRRFARRAEQAGPGRNNRHDVDLNRNWPGLPASSRSRARRRRCSRR